MSLHFNVVNARLMFSYCGFLSSVSAEHRL